MLTLDVIRIATRSFKNNRLRTTLTVLGISIGIGVIFFLVSLGYGFQKLIIDRIATSDSLLTLDVIQENEVVRLDNESLEKIGKIGNVDKISPVVIQDTQVSRDDFISDLKLNIVEHSFFQMEGVVAEVGEIFGENDNEGIVISSAVVQLLDLSGDNLVGENIAVQIVTSKNEETGEREFLDKNYTIRGVIDGESQAFAYIGRESVGDIKFNQYDKIKIRVSSEDKLEEVRGHIINEGYYVSAISDLVNQAKQIFKISQIILALFGIVALVVSAIGMFNTMTITLLERTQEIGIMKTLGASSSVIWRMFLVESIVIGFAGGFTGVILGYAGGWVFNMGINILARNFGGAEVDLFFSPIWFVVFILSFSVIVGAVTGFYPARRASKLNALEALRYK